MEAQNNERKKYWLKLDKYFLKSPQIKVIRAMPNGKDYIIFYLSLMLESIETVGHLRFTSLVPYNDEMLSAITDTNIDIVRTAVKLFCELGLMKIFDDGTIFLPEVPAITGKESESAERVRNYRKRLKEKDSLLALQCNVDVTKSNDNKDKDKDKDKEEDKEEETIYTPYEKIRELYHEICVSYPKIRSLSDNRKTTLKARYKEHGCNIKVFEELFTKAENSDFLKGKTTKWKADFDWLINQANMIKVLEDKYKNDEVKSNGTTKGSDGSEYAEFS